MGTVSLLVGILALSIWPASANYLHDTQNEFLETH